MEDKMDLEKCKLDECINWIEVQVIKVLLKKKRKATINGAEIYKGKATL